MDFLPISILIVSFLIGIVVLLDSINELKLPIYKTIIASVNIIVAVIFFALYNTVIKNDATFEKIYFGIGIFEFLLLLVFIVILFSKILMSKRELGLYADSIKSSPWNTFIILDRRDRITDISDNLLEDLQMTKEEVIKQKLFDILNRAIRITQINGKNFSNRDLEDRFNQYKKINEPNENLKLEISFFNAEGDTTIIHLIDQAMFSRLGYYGRFLIGEKKTDFNLLSVEKQLKQTSLQLETLQEQFIATLEVSNEGLAFTDIEDESMWISDNLVEQLGLVSNDIHQEDFLKLMQPDDLSRYLTKANKLTPSQPNLEMKYRLFTRGVYRWYIEKSKKVFLDDRSMIMSSINLVNTKHFMRSNIQNLDNLGDQNDLLIKLNKLIDEERYFHLAILRVKNLKYINELHSRDVGNMALSEYINKIEKAFTEEDGYVYRISGSTFALILVDQRKMSLIRNGVQANDDYLNMTLEYGSNKLELEVFAGISIINRDGYNENELLDTALKALKVAENPKYKGHICYYEDIWKNWCKKKFIKN